MLSFVTVLALVFTSAQAPPRPLGRLIDIGSHSLHLSCSGSGSPTTIIETGLGDFSFDWMLVQRIVERTSRVCTYDRAGYAWSDAGPEPRTFDQLNLELHTALERAGERGPFVLVAHSFGGGVVRNYVARYPKEVAGLVFVDVVSEHQYIRMGPHAGRIGDDAKGRSIPVARLGPAPVTIAVGEAHVEPVPAMYDVLPADVRALHAWAAAQPTLHAAEDSQREWSAEYFARWITKSSDGIYGARPLIVLTRAKGEYPSNLDKPAEELERARLDAQQRLVHSSSRGTQRVVESGHNMHLEVPDVVARAIRDVAGLARKDSEGQSKDDTPAVGTFYFR
jgi:pimeloyl-ACP methyl ester carboxylesterase